MLTTLLLAAMLTQTCDDGTKNQDEQFVDCGGATCGPCVLYVVDGGWIALTQPQRFLLANAVESGEFGIAATNVDRYVCSANRPAPADKQAINIGEYKATAKWRCQVSEVDPTVTDEEVADMELTEPTVLNPMVCRVTDGDPVRQVCTRFVMTSDGKINNKAFVEDLWSGVPLLYYYEYVCRKDAGIACKRKYYKIGSAKQWRTDRKLQTANGSPRVTSLVGKVAP